MSLLKSCLMIVGLLAFLLVGSCVFGFYSIGSTVTKALNPNEYADTIDETPEKTQMKVYRFLSAAKDDAGGKPVNVQPYSDGSVRLNMGSSEPYDLSIIVNIKPEKDGKASKVEAKWNVEEFAKSRGSSPSVDAYNRAIQSKLRKALSDIDNQRDLSTRFRISTLVEDASEGDFSTAVEKKQKERIAEMRERYGSSYRSKPSYAPVDGAQ